MRRFAMGERIVVDAAAVLDAYVPGVEPKAAMAAAEILSDHATGIVVLCGPPLLPWEVMAVLRRTAASRTLSAAEARDRWDLFTALDIEVLPVDVDRAFRLSEDASLSGYDAGYFALAIEHGLPLVTEARLSRHVSTKHPPAALAALTALHVTQWEAVRPHKRPGPQA